MFAQGLRNTIWVATCWLFCFQGHAQLQVDSLHKLKQTATGQELAKTYLELSTYHSQHFPDSCIFYASAALSIGKELNNAVICIRSYNHIGGAYQTLGKQKESISFYLTAAQIAEAFSEPGLAGASYNGLGINYYSMGDMPKAEHYIQKAAAAKLKAKDYTYYTVILTNLASLYFYKEKYKDAINILKAAEGVLLKENQREYLPTLYNSLGGLYQMAYSNNDSAEFFYRKSLTIAVEKNVPQSIISAYHNLGELSFRRGKFMEAIQFLKQAEEYSMQTPGNAYISNIYTTLSEVYDTIRDYKNAFKYKNLQLEFRNALLEKEKQKAIAELDIKYQTGLKEKQIQRQNEEIQAAKLQAEQDRNRVNLIIFIISFLLLTAIFASVYFWQRRRAARILEQEKSKLFENIVHEIRTPLTLINGPLQLVKNELGDTGQEHVALIEHNSEKLVRLVNELLDVSKLEKGKYLPAYHNGHVTDFVLSIADSFKKDAEHKNISITTDFPTENGHHRFAANVIEKVVGNLLANALKYCPAHSAVIIKMQITDAALIIQIEDNGPGIAEKEQQKIFARFYRPENVQHISGTGIGLSMVKDLVMLVGGDIKLQSWPGHTCFTVTLPIEKLDSENGINTITDDARPCLLIVEDDEALLKFVSSIFHNDYNLIAAQNGQEGIEKSLAQVPDIILTDVMMPIKNGVELLQEVKENALTKHIPVVVFSAKSSIESRLDGLKHGADAYVSKPFHVDELKMIVQNLLHTMKQNQQEFVDELKGDKPFEERIQNKNEYINQAISFIIKNMENADYSVNELADDMCISRSQLHRKLSSLTGFSTSHFIKTIRLEKAKDLLRSQAGNVSEVAYACGFSSQSYFTKSFTEYVGESPSGYMKKAIKQ